MIDLRRRRNLGDTAEEYLEELALFLDSDGEGLWAIVPAGKSFGFGGPDLSEFVKCCVLRLLSAQGIPVRHAGSGVLLWREQTHYGNTHEEIADAIVGEWLAAGGGSPEWGWLWFVTRDVLKTARRSEHPVPSTPPDTTKFVLEFYNSTIGEASTLNVYGKSLYAKVTNYLAERRAIGKCTSPKSDYYILDEEELRLLRSRFNSQE